MGNNQKTDLDLANEALVAIKPNVTTSDRVESGYSEFTVVQYLKGEGRDLDTAMELLLFFRKRIEDRRKHLV